MTEEKKPFTVSDRRHFTPEGEARSAEDGPGEAPPARAGEPVAASAGSTAGPYPLDFTGLLLSLGTQAAMLLGGGEQAEGAPPADPEGARAFITLLEVLQEKTQGRRTPEEDQVLESMLFQLRLEYVHRTQVKGA
ncbi:MAG TPA: DUF1844 domain-containing protein [Vicinamibacteria bacterium]|nr:DUF1844 domain-containing protein [Vicinamibacteria bacterium]